MTPTVCGHQQMSMPHAEQIIVIVIQSSRPEKTNDNKSYKKFKYVTYFTLYMGTMLTISNFLKGDAVSIS